jgi:ATPase subunit of ABC transporter with duplicated ATPase domains
MDEPTRNLSPLSAPVMRDMIRSFPGAMICVTHDRLLIQDWPGRVLELTELGLVEVRS